MRVIQLPAFSNLFAASFSSLLIISFSTLITGCMHVDITDKQYIRPDSATGYKLKQKLTQDDIQKINPSVQLRDETVIATDQTKLEGLAFQQNASKVTVLYFGGNLSHVEDSLPFMLKTIGSCNVNLVSFDYRGYGRTAGVPNINNMQEDALKIYDAMRAKTTGKLVVHGHSMGSFATGFIAEKRQPDGIILETTASNVRDMVALSTPWYAKPFVSVNIQDSLQQVDNIRAMSNYHGPALVLTAEKDKQTPAELGQKVYEAIPSKAKRQLFIKDAGHSGLLRREDVQKAYCEYIQQVSL